MKLRIVMILVLAAIAIQFIPYGKEHSNPAVVAEPQWDTPQTRETFTRVCGNCHSNETVWPAYSNIAPISWLIQSDVDEGREHLNISMWGAQEKNLGHEAAKEVKDGEMPPWFYLIGHPEARLSDPEKAAFVAGLTATFGEKK